MTLEEFENYPNGVFVKVTTNDAMSGVKGLVKFNPLNNLRGSGKRHRIDIVPFDNSWTGHILVTLYGGGGVYSYNEIILTNL
tara:strand:+ start:561 stop:806 length:246 start_codon:yes stop_codon:yes gene_type:complete